MLEQSDAVKQAWQASERTLDIVINVNGTDYQATSINSLSYDAGAFTGDSLGIGSTYENSVSVEFSSVIEAFAAGQVVKPQIGIEVNGDFEYTPLGVFIISEVNKDRNNNLTTIKALDQMVKLERDYTSTLTYPAAMLDVVAEIASQGGVTVNQTDLAHLPNLPKLNSAITGQTLRTAIGWVAQFYSGFATFDRDGKLTIRTTATPDYEINPSEYMQGGLTKNEVTYQTGGIKVSVTTTSTTETGEQEDKTTTLQAGETSGSQIELTNNVMTNDALSTIWTSIKDVSFYPYSLNWFGNPALEAGDWVTLTDTQGNKFNAPVNQLTFTFNGGLESTISANQASQSSTVMPWTGPTQNAITQAITRKMATGNNVYDPSFTEEPKNAKIGDVWFKQNGNNVELWTYSRDSSGNASWQKQEVDGEAKAEVENATSEAKAYSDSVKAQIEADAAKTKAELDSNIADAQTAADNAKAMAGNAINYYKEQYYVSTSYTTMTGGDWSDTPPGKAKGNYIWIRYVTTNANGSQNTSTPYCISGLDGEDGATGPQGVPGPKGADGKTTYVHFAYANITDLAGEGTNFTLSAQTVVRWGAKDSGEWIYKELAPGTYTANNDLFGGHDPAPWKAKVIQAFCDFSVSESNARAYIGQYTDYTQDDSTSPSSYNWTKIKGDTGPQGPQGEPGSTGFFIGTTPPPNPTKGAVWATADSSGNMTSAKTWNGSDWVSTAFTQDLVAGNITASKIVGGELDVNKITVKNAQNIPITSTVSLGQKLSSIEQDADKIKFSMAGQGLDLIDGLDGKLVMCYGIPDTTWDGANSYLALPTTPPAYAEVLPQNTTSFALYYKWEAGKTYTQSIIIETDAQIATSVQPQWTWFTGAGGHNAQPAELIDLGNNCYRLIGSYTPDSNDTQQPLRILDIFNFTSFINVTTGTYLKFRSPHFFCADDNSLSELKITANGLKAYIKESNGSSYLATLLNQSASNASLSALVNGQVVSAINVSSSGDALIAGKKIMLDGDVTIVGTAFASKLKATGITVDQLVAGNIDASKINVINLNANNITAGAINGNNLSINLDNGQVAFTKGSLHSTDGMFNIDLDNKSFQIQPNNGVGLWIDSNGLHYKSTSTSDLWINKDGFHSYTDGNPSGTWIKDDSFTNADASGQGVTIQNGNIQFSSLPYWSSDNSKVYGSIYRDPNGFGSGVDGLVVEGTNGITIKTSAADDTTSGASTDGFLVGNKNGAFLTLANNTSKPSSLYSKSTLYLTGGQVYSRYNLTSQPTVSIGTDEYYTHSGAYMSSSNGTGQGTSISIHGSNVNVSAPGWINFEAQGDDGRIAFKANYIHLYPTYLNVTSAGANVYVDADGSLVRSASAAKYKTDIQPANEFADYGDKLISLTPKVWLDKAEVKRYKDDPDKNKKPGYYYGLIADELDQAGLNKLVTYGADGQVEGIQYDRLAVALLPIIKKLKEDVKELKERILK